MNINKLFEGQREKFRRAFFENYGANKIWVSPSRQNVQDIHDIHDLAQNHFTESFVKFLDIEIDRLDKEKKQDKCNKEEECPWCERNMYCRGREDAIGYNASIADQITHLQDIKRQLTESK